MRKLIIGIIISVFVSCTYQNDKLYDSVYLFMEYDNNDNLLSVYVINASSGKIAETIYEKEYFLYSEGDRYECFIVNTLKVTDPKKYLPE